VSVLLYGKQTLCCGTIANTDQHLCWIKNFKNMISIIISTKADIEWDMMLNQEV
jgi:hypothetical protein